MNVVVELEVLLGQSRAYNYTYWTRAIAIGYYPLSILLTLIIKPLMCRLLVLQGSKVYLLLTELD